MCSKMADTYACFLQYNLFSSQHKSLLSHYQDELGFTLTEVSRCQSICLFLNPRFFTTMCPSVASDAAVMKRQRCNTQMSVIDFLKDRTEVSCFMIEFYQGCLLNEYRKCIFQNRRRPQLFHLSIFTA